MCVWRLEATCLRGENSQGDASHTSENSGCRQQSSSSLPAATDADDLTLHLALAASSEAHWEARRHPGAPIDVFYQGTKGEKL